MNNKYCIWNTFLRLWPMISPFKKVLILGSFALVLNSISDVFILALLKPLLDEGFSKIENKILIWMPLTIIGLIIVKGISSFVSNYCIFWVSGKVVMNMRRKLFNHMTYMPISFFTKQSTGTLLSRITYDSEQIASSSSTALVILVRESTLIISLFIMMFYHSWKLSLILLIISPIVSIAIQLISKKFYRISKNIQNTMGEINTNTEQMLKGHKEVLTFGGQKIENDVFKKVSNLLRRQAMRMVTASSISDPLIQFIASLALVFILYIASFPKVISTLTSGTITVIFSSMVALMRPLKSLTNINAKFQRGMAACQTLFTILDMKKEKDEGHIKLQSVQGNIKFQNVTFCYPGNSIPILEKFNLEIPSNSTVAFVGRSGSGKSTIANLLMRFYEIQQGSIFLDGKKIQDYKLSSLRRQIALISQDIHLFNDTIENNIAYACKNFYSKKQIENAARMAYAMDFIEKMENGLNTVIGENGVLLSKGQRQRIAIARALLRDCPILIFDEITSFLDPESEQKIQKVIDKLKESRTLIIIGHNFSILKKVEKIFVIENGKITETGNHSSLIKNAGIYAHLYKIQLKLL